MKFDPPSAFNVARLNFISTHFIIYFLNGRVKFKRRPWVKIASLSTLLGGESFVIPDVGSLSALLGVGVLSTTIGWSLISSAIREIPATLAGLVLLTQPALSFLWDILIFHRPTTGIEAVGIVLILGGIYAGSYRRE